VEWCSITKPTLVVVLSPLLLHKSGSVYILPSESHHHLTPSNVTSKLTTLPHHNTHHLATIPRTSDLICKLVYITLHLQLYYNKGVYCNTCDRCANDELGDGSNYLAAFIVAMVLQAFGAVPLYVLGITYLDDASPPATASVHIGINAH